MYHNNQNNSQYYQSNIPQQFSNGYTQTLRINNDVRATEIGLRPNNNYQDNQKQKDYKNYKQLIS
ncbi:hypothetical protein BCR36DRAFT_583205 [Piromyces finnis]|uniref:Uncharacterized protein n=1 Tax=Piromyces finnis TaxID=1754191 RepID=A0A1Y1V9H7_9FUNG|nr:hypothetical protein BCR36DRAFT_583205 [Piromyces finnis]|eukprot:ORX50619.1 hypothetical protein BCR36DRAFT_583205 [Piromyces finnis]